MKQKTSPYTLSAQTRASLTIGFLAVVCLFIGSGVIAYFNTRMLLRNARSVAQTHEVLISLNQIISFATDAETGQRGYVITGDPEYLEPYNKSKIRIKQLLNSVDRLIADNPIHQNQMPALKANLQSKLDELEETIEIRRTQGYEAAKEIVVTDRGKATMDLIRETVKQMEDSERNLRLQRFDEMNDAYKISIRYGIVTSLVGLILSVIVFYLIRRTILGRQQQDWLQSGQINLSSSLVGDLRVQQVGENLLRFLSEYLDAHVGAFFFKDGNIFRQAATYGVYANGAPKEFSYNDGLLGQSAKDGKTLVIEDAPKDYLLTGSALGKGAPRHLIIVPVKADDNVNAVFELGFLNPLNKWSKTLLDNVADVIGTAVQSANYRDNLQNFLEETQRQAEELQAQGEELRVSNEELEEQSRALRESQRRLEHQQAELEESNAQLEEQTQILENQRDDIAQSKAALQQQAQELRQASQYKSDFLANMSHELRTPLNSSLILAKLLADNPQNNLTDEQVTYAQTIQASGNDLLALINDILDLSKIEAGRMDIRPTNMHISDLVSNLKNVFQPVAGQRKVQLNFTVASGVPKTIETDLQRLEQVLKNLLSNALKFTEEGSVDFSVAQTKDSKVIFTVKDTGIGIPKHQQEMIFEAFRQADGTTNRRYGGTGLGLSIARELTRLLGGEIQLKSAPKEGSTFSVIIPQTYDPLLVQSLPEALTQRFSFIDTSDKTDAEPAQTTENQSYRRMPDDRDNLSGNARIILVVEDDFNFAKIIYDLSHELSFQCIIATSAEEGLAMAAQHRPSAIILDIGLPDNSGLSVLDRIKRDARTRHIPVHVISAHDYSQTAKTLGAVGYMIKPVKREELARAFEQLEDRLEQRLRRVLIVEDDKVQLDSLRKLLDVHQVETVGAMSAAECLEQLKNSTFDCMVLDLSLPDASGYSLLETLSREDKYSFPPVIVYTGRDLSSKEEETLRKYSKSIIIKGAKSPERLLDEVTLFLHQVVSELPPQQQKMLEISKNRDTTLEGRRILVVEDDVRNVFALTSILEPRGATVQIARNGKEALTALGDSTKNSANKIDLVLMDIMMPEMDGITAIKEIRKRTELAKTPIIALTAKAMRDDQEQCINAGANDYMAKPLDVEKLLSLIRVWMPR